MPIRTPIQTSIGLLTYRDCIFLDRVEVPGLNSLKLSGELNTSVITNYRAPFGWDSAEDLPFHLHFHSVLGFQMLELDTWFEQHSNDDSLDESSFDEITESLWLAKLKGHETKLSPEHRHFQCFTYDDVFDVIAVQFTLQVGDEVQP